MRTFVVRMHTTLLSLVAALLPGKISAQPSLGDAASDQNLTQYLFDLLQSGSVDEAEMGMLVRTILALIIATLSVSWALILRRRLAGRTAIQRQLLRQLSFQRALMDNMPVPLFIRDTNGILLACNQTYLDCFGMSADEIIGTDMEFLARYVPSTPTISTFYEHVYNSRQPNVSELVVTVQGKLHHAHVWAAPFHDQYDNLEGVVGGFLDLTERFRLENELREARDAAEKARNEAVRANESKSRFLSSVSHDMRTPLNVIITTLDLQLHGDQLSIEQRDALETAQDSAVQLLELIDDMLDVARIEAGVMNLSPKPVHLGQLLEKIRQMFTVIAQQKGLDLRTEFSGTDVWVELDPLRLRQILCNLLSNAIKFTPCGYVLLKADFIADGDHAKGVFVVKDTGVGIAKDEQPHLYEPFMRASHAAREQIEGTGLGLTICRYMTGLFGGTIELISAPGEGTTITVDIPLTVTKSVPDESSAATRAAPIAARSNLNVLIADDHPFNLKVLRAQFEQLGCSVTCAADGQIALNAWRNGHFDLIVTDWSMPGLNGAGLMRAVRQEERERGRPRGPIICLSAHANSHVASEALAAGADENLVKPVTLEQWSTVLTRLGLPDSLCAQPKQRAAQSANQADLLHSMLEIAVQDIRKAYDHLANYELVELAQLAHRMKGPLLFTKLHEAAELCEELEAFCNEEADLEVIRDAIARLAKELQVIKKQIEHDTHNSSLAH